MGNDIGADGCDKIATALHVITRFSIKITITL
jgi:hypothetical protein